MARDASLVPRLFTGATDRTQIAYSEIPDETPSGATLRVAARRPQRLQILPKAPDEADVGEAERAMRGCALFVVGLGIRRELGAPDRTRPPLRGGEELSANAAVPRFGDDEPALEETDTIGIAALGVRSDGELGKAQQAGSIFRDEERGRLSAREEPFDLASMLRLRAVRPERVPKPRQRSGIGKSAVPHLYGLDCSAFFPDPLLIV